MFCVVQNSAQGIGPVEHSWFERYGGVCVDQQPYQGFWFSTAVFFVPRAAVAALRAEVEAGTQLGLTTWSRAHTPELFMWAVDPGTACLSFAAVLLSQRELSNSLSVTVEHTQRLYDVCRAGGLSFEVVAELAPDRSAALNELELLCAALT